MAELFTVKNESMVSVPDPIAPIIDPLGEKPTASALSPGNAALGAIHESSNPRNILGLLSDGQGARNLVFVAIVGFLVWKYGRSVINA